MSTPAPDHSGPAASGGPMTYTPGFLLPKWLYLCFGLLVFAFAAWMIWDPLGRLLFGDSAMARVREVVRIEPGQPDQAFRYRRNFEPETNMTVRFQHYVSLQLNGTPVQFRLGVDSRKLPYANVNDRIRVVFHPDDPSRIAYAPGQARTWGMAVLYLVVSICFLSTGIPMLVSARRPVVIDPEAPAPAPQAARD